MSAEAMELFDRCRQRFRDDLAPVRAEFADWLRVLFKKRKPTERATSLYCVIRNLEMNHPMWNFCWDPGPHSRSWNFQHADPLPPLISLAEIVALGLDNVHPDTMKLLACQDLTVDAWAEAGGFSFARPLYFHPWMFRSPDDPRPWVDWTRDLIRQMLSGERPPGRRVEVDPPVFGKVPAVSAEIIDAVRAGEPAAIQAWADALAEAGDSASAALLRWLPGFYDHLAEDVRLVAPEQGFQVYSADRMTYWFIGDCESDYDNDNTRNLRRLLAGWNDFHPAAEWLYRRLGMPSVAVETRRVADGQLAERRVHDLAAGDHFGPFEPDVGVTRLSVEPFAEQG